MKNHPLYETCRRAHSWISFNPERRAEQELTWYEENIAEFATLCGDDTERFADIKAKYTKKFLELMGAKSRCASSAITGGSGFNVARAEKANKAEHTKSGELSEWVAKVKKNLAPKTGNEPIKSDDENAIETLKKQLANCEAWQVKIVASNKLLKKGDYTAYKELVGEEEARKHLGFVAQHGQSWLYYGTTNNNAEIKRLKDRIAGLEKIKSLENVEFDINGVRVLQNVDAMRLQLFFDGKPAVAMIELLKRHGFKWSPNNTAWQRLLNANAIYSFNHYIRPSL